MWTIVVPAHTPIAFTTTQDGGNVSDNAHPHEQASRDSTSIGLLHVSAIRKRRRLSNAYTYATRLRPMRGDNSCAEEASGIRVCYRLRLSHSIHPADFEPPLGAPPPTPAQKLQDATDHAIPTPAQECKPELTSTKNRSTPSHRPGRLTSHLMADRAH